MSATAIVFPGQGSQRIGMMKEFADAYPIVNKYFDKASNIVDIDLWQICQEDDNAHLNQTAFTQPIMLTAGYVAYQILKQETGIKPDYMAGHSLGEYTALCAAGAMTFEEAIHLVHRRGELMQRAVPNGGGAMAVIIGLTDKQVADVCASVEGQVAPANFNAPGQVVIAGQKDAVEAAEKAAKEAGAKRAMVLPVSVPSHSVLMKPAAANLSLALEKVNWQKPDCEIIYNVDARTRSNKEGAEAALGAQLYSPVLWTRCVEELAKRGVTKCIECGPGKVLTGLSKRITKELTTVAFDQPAALDSVKALLES